MATVYGSWKPSSTSVPRMRLYITYTIDSVDAGDTSTVVRPVCKLEFYGNVSDSSNTFTRGGTLTSSMSTPVSIDGGYQTFTLDDFDKTVTLTDSTQSKTLTYSLTGINAIGTSYTATVSATITIPAKVYDPPATPSAFSVSRTSDVKHTLSWSASPTTAAPITAFDIQRSVNDATFTTVATLSGSARSWIDTTNHANKKIEWRIRARNTEGSSSYVESANWYGTPATPQTAPTAVKSGSNIVITTTDDPAPYGNGWTWEHSTDGGSTWSFLASTNEISGADTYTHVSPNSAETHTYRARQWMDSNPNAVTLHSGYTPASATVQLLTPPLAPTLVAPLGTVSSTAATVFTWEHRPVDTTAQTAAELGWSDDDGSSWTTLTATTAETLTVAAETWSPGTVLWKVRTKGAHAAFGPWSATASFTVADPPAVTITSPADLSTWTSNLLQLSISFTDNQGASMVSWSADLLTGGQVIDSINITGSATNSIFSNTTLEDGTDYTVNVRAVSGTGLTSEDATATVTVDFIDPLPPTLEAEWDDANGTTNFVVGFTVPTGGEAATDHVRIERFDEVLNGWVLVADDLPDSAGAGDDQVPLNIDAAYRAVAVSANGVQAYTWKTVTTTSSRAWLASDLGRIQLHHGLQMSPAFGHEVVMETYLGDTYPTAHYGSARPVTISLTATWLGDERQQDVNVVLGRDVYYRDPAGRAFTASVSSVSVGNPSSLTYPISLKVEQTND